MPSRQLNRYASSLKALSNKAFAEGGRLACTKFCHPPVDSLHSPENTRVKYTLFLLTLKIERVKP